MVFNIFKVYHDLVFIKLKVHCMQHKLNVENGIFDFKFTVPF